MTRPNGGSGSGSSGGAGTGPRRDRASIYVRLERQIAATSTTDLLARWKFGRELLKAKAGRKKLPTGHLDGVIVTLAREGIEASRRDLQYRMRLAEVYETEGQLRKINCAIGGWTEIIAAGFPPVEADPADDPDSLPDAISPDPHDSWEQLSLIPGLGEVLKVRGRSVPLAEATISDVRAYRDMYAGIHENFTKRLAQIDNALSIMTAVEPDPEGNALNAWRRGLSEQLT